MTKKYVIKPKDPEYNKYWDKKYSRWDPYEHFNPERHVTDDLAYADGEMSEGASRFNPATNLPAKKPVPVKRVEIKIIEE